VARLRLLPRAGGTASIDIEIESLDEPARALPRPTGRRRSLFESAYRFDYFPDDDVIYLSEDGVVARCDASAGRARIAVRPGDPRARFLATHLMLTLPLVELMKRRDHFAVHAAGVAMGSRVAMLAGPGGSGKSTLALTCVRAGFAFLGDDVLFLSVDGGRQRIAAFPDELDIADSALGFFPDLQRDLATVPPPAGRPKRPLHPERHGPLEIAWDAEPAALVFPAVGARTEIEPLSAEAALVALVPNVIRTETAASQRHLDALGLLARRCPAYRLNVRDPRDVPPLLRRMLASPDG
jgi:hypothetical protein